MSIEFVQQKEVDWA